MIYPFIQIRFKQILRDILNIGIFRFLVAAFLLIFLSAVIFSLCDNKKYAHYLTIAILFFILSIQFKRHDKTFLKTNFRYYQLYYLADYYLICLIPSCFLLWHFRVVDVLILLFGCFFICFLDANITHSTRNTKLQQWIPGACFEWKSGVRKMFVPMVIFMIIGLCGSFLIAVVPIIILFLSFCILDFYSKNEPYQFVLSYEFGSKRFLFYKIKMQIYLFSVLIAPLFILFIIFHYQYWYIIIIEYIILISLQNYNILLKYAFYIPNGQTPTAYIMIGLLFGLFMPIFIPIIWVLSIYFYFKAQRILNFYLNDYN
ncbi:MAG: hypothetical protein FWF54_08465 [Candidatus Azobacteroides sp.]|nr:hypothetical protein [Candidatus Azobacteroides sp.]